MHPDLIGAEKPSVQAKTTLGEEGCVLSQLVSPPFPVRGMVGGQG